MKRFAIVFVLFFLSTNIFGQTEKLNSIFDQYQEAQGVTTIKIAKPMFSMLNKLNIRDSELDKIKPLLGKIKGLNILIMEKPTFPEELAKENVVPLAKYAALGKEIMTAVSKLNYEELITVNSRDSKIKFLAGEAKDGILDNLLLNITTDNNTILMVLDGKLSMDDVSKLIEETKTVTALNPISSINSTSNTNSVREVSPFEGIEVSTGVNVKFTLGDATSVVVDTDVDKQQYVITEVENGVLKIFVRNNNRKELNFKRLNVNVTSPKLNKIQTKSGAYFSAVNTIVSKNMAVQSSSGSKVDGQFEITDGTSVDASSGSSIKMNLGTSTLAVESTSGSFVKLTGSADTISASVTSGASCDAVNFVTQKAVVSASSGSSIKVNTSENLTVSVSSAASVQYKGNPKNIVSDVSKITGASLNAIN